MVQVAPFSRLSEAESTYAGTERLPTVPFNSLLEALADSVGMDDYSLTRVPAEARYPWWSIAEQRFGQVSALTQFLLGAALGFGMSFWGAFWALTLGAVILEIAMIFVGIIGMREGLSTSILAR